MTIAERKEAQADARKKVLERAQAYSIGELVMFHQLRFVHGKAHKKSYTKKGPGRIPY